LDKPAVNGIGERPADLRAERESGAYGEVVQTCDGGALVVDRCPERGIDGQHDVQDTEAVGAVEGDEQYDWIEC
jgi:hypothetical protein